MPTHWIAALPILLIVAWLALRQIDAYPAAVDEFWSMFNAGWLAESDYAPSDVMASLRRYSPDHTPLYFLLLNLWGKLAGHALAVGRVLSALCSLMALSLAYRLARDYVAATAGLLALAVFCGNAFFNFYIADLRMYPLLVLLSGLALWLYLRMVKLKHPPRQRDYLALGACALCLIGTHVFAALFLAMLGAYHLIFVSKDRRWLWIALSLGVGAALNAPWLLQMLGDIDAVSESKAHVAIGGIDAIGRWLAVVGNDQPLLPLLSAVGLALAARQRRFKPGPQHIMFIFFALALGGVAETTALILRDSMRHHLAGWLPYVLFCAAGLHALYLARRWLAWLAVGWLLAGVVFQASASWWHYIVLRSLVFTQPPTHIISRLALDSSPRPAVFAYPYDQFYAPFALEHAGNKGYSQREHYFTRHGIAASGGGDIDAFDEFARRVSIDSPLIWHVTPAATPADDAAHGVLRALHYEPCDAFPVGGYTLVHSYMWRQLDCALPDAAVKGETERIAYQFHTATLDEQGGSLRFVDLWQPRGEHDLSAWSLSHQLIGEDWQRVAGLDLPLVHAGKLRRFSIDISGAPTGSYRLMLVLYNRNDGQRASWTGNIGGAPDMLTLTEIVIS